MYRSVVSNVGVVGHGNNNVGAAGSNASTSTEDGALYTVDHLATFTVGESYGKYTSCWLNLL